MGYERTVRELLAPAGVTVNGSEPWDIRVHRESFFRRALHGSLGFGESYMDGDWDCEQLDELVARLTRARLWERVRSDARTLLHVAAARTMNIWSRRSVSRKVAPHYNLGNDLFETILDTEHMAYTCAYFRDEHTTLEEAQTAKIELVCDKLDVQKGTRLLDIGCGWGGLAKYAARHRGAEVVGVTLSRDQAELGSERCRGLPVEIRTMDYRDVHGSFDRVASVGCLEHVGHRNHRTYFQKIHDCLPERGHAVVQTIGTDETAPLVGGFIDKYVFPLVNPPSIEQIGKAINGLFVLEDVQNIGPHYDPTLMEWNRRFQAAWSRLEPRYGHLLGGRFRRMFEFYLMGCAGYVRGRGAQVWQLVLAKGYGPQPVCRVG